jgi:hypothetical protein
MCHGHVSMTVLEREVQDRVRAARPALAASEGERATPPRPAFGWRGALARLVARIRRPQAAAAGQS